jgi:hypothetical protein
MDFGILLNKVLLIEIICLNFYSHNILLKNPEIFVKMWKYAEKIYAIFHKFLRFFEKNIKVDI